MLGRHARFTISAKVALYQWDGQRVLVMKYPKAYGLPGGHLEKNEVPDEAILRELREELGLTIDVPRQTGFFRRNGHRGSIILGYTATLPKDAVIAPTHYEKEHGEWVSREDIRTLHMSEGYRKLILDNWPVANKS